jgi:hypothetical protein
MYLAAPSANNPWPSLLAFVDGRFRVSDLTIRIAGAPTQGWSIFGIAPPIQALAHGIAILGGRAEATIENVTIEGEELPSDLLYGYNVYNGILFEGFIGADSPPLAGSLTVRHCVFRHVASGAPVAHLRDTTVWIMDNRFEDVLLGAEAVDFSGTRYSFLGNHVSADWAGVDLYDMCLGPSASCGVVDSKFTVAANLFEKRGCTWRNAGSPCGAMSSRTTSARASAPTCSWAQHPRLFVVGTGDVEDQDNNHVIP